MARTYSKLAWQRAKATLFKANSVALARWKFEKHVSPLGKNLIAIGILLLMLAGVVQPAFAHANLARSNPAANQVLETAPPMIRLWFTEPLEPEFSSFSLRDEDGNKIDMPAAQLDPDDPTMLTLEAADLPEGIYTVVWRVVSSVDGHQTQGSFAFSIGVPFAGFASATPDEDVPWTEVPLRALNVLSMAVGIGSLAFWLFVYPAAEPDPQMEKRMWRLICFGWGMMGIGAVLVLLLQVHIAAETITPAALQQVALETRFGVLWLIQLGIWLLMGAVLLFMSVPPEPGQDTPPIMWLGMPFLLLLGIGILLLHSLRGHASAAYELNAAVGGQWLHLTATVIWLGGLCQFLNVALLRPSTENMARLTAAFSNLARSAVIVLVITGAYAGWLHVGSWRGVTDTTYGQALLLKLLLALPVLGIAAINLLITQRRLAQGEAIWAGRLRGLISAEVLLLIGVIGAVSIMTAISPARSTLAVQDSQPKAPEPHPILVEKTAEGLDLNLTITPGWVGENDFLLQIRDAAGNPVEDASLIRLRFEHQQQNLGESELRPEHQGDGIYRVSGANLSIPGNWQIRTTIQRPGQFDIVTDLALGAPSAPLIPPPTVIDPNDLPEPHALILISLGLAATGISGFFLGQASFRSGTGLLASGLACLGLVFLFYGAAAFEPSSTQAAAYIPPPDMPEKLAFTYAGDLPYLLMPDGTLMQPTDTQTWEPLPFTTPINDVFIDSRDAIWAATDSGLFRYQHGTWQDQDGYPVQQVVIAHGLFFLLRPDGLRRGSDNFWEALDLPSPFPPSEIVMLGDHRHVLRSGGDLNITGDLGLTWEKLAVPVPIQQIAASPEGSLIAVTDTHLITWDGVGWQNYLTFPGGATPTAFKVFAEQLFAIADGKLYRQQGQQWQVIPLADDSYCLGLALQFNRKIWVLDGKGSRLWFSSDGEAWESVRLDV